MFRLSSEWALGLLCVLSLVAIVVFVVTGFLIHHQRRHHARRLRWFVSIDGLLIGAFSVANLERGQTIKLVLKAFDAKDREVALPGPATVAVDNAVATATLEADGVTVDVVAGDVVGTANLTGSSGSLSVVEVLTVADLPAVALKFVPAP